MREDGFGLFQSPRSGKFESNIHVWWILQSISLQKFQSPRSGKFESNNLVATDFDKWEKRFNPLDRGNLNQIPRAWKKRACYF